MNSVEETGGCPRTFWTDCGTENVIIAALQHVFHDSIATNQQTYCSEVTFRDQCRWSRMFDLYTVEYC